MPNTVGPAETILEPDLPIIDPHHHLWDRPADLLAGRPTPAHGFDTVIARSMRYLLPEFLADLNSGHNIRAPRCSCNARRCTALMARKVSSRWVRPNLSTAWRPCVPAAAMAKCAHALASSATWT